MSSSSFKKDFVIGTPGAISRARAEIPGIISKKAWEVYLKPKQVFVLWGLAALALFVSFLFGYYSGRSAGVEIALRQAEDSVSATRLPLARPIVSSAGTNKLVADSKVRAALNIAKDSKEPASSSLVRAETASKDSALVARGAVPGFSLKAKLEPAWYVQINALRTEEEARKYWAANVRQAGPLVVEQARTGALSYFRMLSGPFKTESEAKSKLADLQRKGLSQGKAFVRRVSQ